MNRIVEISLCDECPFFDNQYYTFNEKCKKLKRMIEVGENHYSFPIPDDCPLDVAND